MESKTETPETLSRYLDLLLTAPSGRRRRARGEQPPSHRIALALAVVLLWSSLHCHGRSYSSVCFYSFLWGVMKEL
ncbi:hypothetical protein E2C01_006355 [Portunus trituberculatus]|uniref:Uncharacterized protein n=1 Tax=Portunus trituberculatus TaxID=210409 RepID=A0A5B7CWY9_PORTR|nr:hypothetical protein [Portunus trituberculatus]